MLRGLYKIVMAVAVADTCSPRGCIVVRLCIPHCLLWLLGSVAATESIVGHCCHQKKGGGVGTPADLQGGFAVVQLTSLAVCRSGGC
jgi:hypothetical protein